ncbi:MAG TPA: hypothetical protein VG755_45490 [Nannocystaceae bacterium]|nr:hypothetical protein [Nannocystaceae bacterium]
MIAAAAVLLAASLQWRAPAECPDAAHVEARARALAIDPAAVFDAHAEITREPSGEYRLVLAIGDRVEHHAARDCEVLAELTALVVAVATDPVAVATVVPEAIAPTVGTTTPAIAAPLAPSSSPPRTATTRRKRSPWVTVLATHGIAGVAELPRIDAGLDLALSIERPRFAVQARGAWLFARRTAIPGLPARAQLSAGNGSLRACAVWNRRALALLGCGGIELGAIVASSLDVRRPDTVTSLWVAAFGSASLRGWLHPRVALELGADLLFALRRPRFVLRDDENAIVSAGVGGIRGWAGIAVRLAPRP